ncbi:hypothetical protein [Mesorhizobium sp. L-8-10]|nr:hypothetical protein [Mesorhizobium sp. L-8-10]
MVAADDRIVALFGAECMELVLDIQNEMLELSIGRLKEKASAIRLARA